MAQALFYSSNAVAMTLAAGIASGDVTCNLSSTSGLPASFPFKLLIGWGTAQQEVVHCTALSGVIATITRGQDGTTAQAHSIGATVVHGVSAREFNDLEAHIAASVAVHGLAGAVVGTTDSQALTNKTFDATSTISGAPIVGTTTVQTLTGKTLTSPAINGGVLDAASTVGGVSGTSLAADRTAWSTWSPTIANFTLGNGTLTARFKQVGKTVHVRLIGTLGSTSSISGSLAVPLPVTAVSADEQLLVSKYWNGSNLAEGLVTIAPGGTSGTLWVPASTTAALSAFTGTSLGVGLTTGGSFAFQGTYESV